MAGRGECTATQAVVARTETWAIIKSVKLALRERGEAMIPGLAQFGIYGKLGQTVSGRFEGI